MNLIPDESAECRLQAGPYAFHFVAVRVQHRVHVVLVGLQTGLYLKRGGRFGVQNPGVPGWHIPPPTECAAHLFLGVVAARGEPGCHLSGLRRAEGEVVDLAGHRVEAPPNHALDQNLIRNLRADQWELSSAQSTRKLYFLTVGTRFGFFLEVLVGFCWCSFSVLFFSFRASVKLIPLLGGEPVARHSTLA